jgi:hypothetical protein
MLLERSADPNAKVPGQDGASDTSILIRAADYELWQICELLLDHGADLHYSAGGWTATDEVKQSLQNYALLRQATPDDLVRLAKRLNLPVTSDTPQ